MDVNLTIKAPAYSAVREQGEHYDLLEGQEVEPNSYEQLSYLGGPKRIKAKKRKKKKHVSSEAYQAKTEAKRKKVLGGVMTESGAYDKMKKGKFIKSKGVSVGATSTKPKGGSMLGGSSSISGMSMPVKIGIGVGVVAVLGIIIYVATKKKK